MNIPVKRGMLLRHHEHLYFVDDLTERHSGQQRPVVHVSLHTADDGRHVERTLDELQPIEEVPWGYRTVQYLYSKGGRYLFMDTTIFDEFELTPAALSGFEPFLLEGSEYRLLTADGRPLHLDVPDSVMLRVEDTAAPSRAVGASSNILKDALLQHNIHTRVPMFIKTGDIVRISTATRQYLGKATIVL
jgi:elongation factor P